jgi:hypothetical protein
MMVRTQCPIKPKDNRLVEQLQPHQQQVCDSLPQTKQCNFSNKACNSPRFRFRKCFSLFPGHSTQWRPLLPKGGGLIQVDIGGHPPFPNSNWLILTVLSSSFFSVKGTFLCNCGFYNYGVVLKPYTISRWILVAAHLFQLAYFGSFHVSTSLCTYRVFWGSKQCFTGLPQSNYRQSQSLMT